MAAPPPVQTALFADEAPAFDGSFSRVRRVALDARSWVDHGPGWLTGADALFETLMKTRSWKQRTRVIFEKPMLEPRLTDFWLAESGTPLQPPLLEQMRAALRARYGVPFDSVGFNFYRNGADSVAWHRDKIDRRLAEPVVVLVSLGGPRRLLLRPHGGGTSVPFTLGAEDLLVTGGRTQRDWEHSLPKVARAAPRMSLAFRHGMLRGSYLAADEANASPRAD